MTEPGVFTGALSICRGDDDFSLGGQSCVVFTIVRPLVSRSSGADFVGDGAWFVAGVVAGAFGTRVERVGDTPCINSGV